jgi:hypothetical protein
MQTSTSTGASSQDQQLRAQLELLKDHDPDPSSASAASSSRDSAGTPTQPSHLPPPASASNGYDPLHAASQDAARALVVKHEGDSHIHPDLRARPAQVHAPAHGHGHVQTHVPTHVQAPPANMMPIAPPSGHSPGPALPGPPNPNIAPAPSATSPMEDVTNDGRKAKRELSQSKRAAQNRAAQVYRPHRTTSRFNTPILTIQSPESFPST